MSQCGRSVPLDVTNKGQQSYYKNLIKELLGWMFSFAFLSERHGLANGTDWILGREKPMVKYIFGPWTLILSFL